MLFTSAYSPYVCPPLAHRPPLISRPATRSFRDGTRLVVWVRLCGVSRSTASVTQKDSQASEKPELEGREGQCASAGLWTVCGEMSIAGSYECFIYHCTFLRVCAADAVEAYHNHPPKSPTARIHPTISRTRNLKGSMGPEMHAPAFCDTNFVVAPGWQP